MPDQGALQPAPHLPFSYRTELAQGASSSKSSHLLQHSLVAELGSNPDSRGKRSRVCGGGRLACRFVSPYTLGSNKFSLPRRTVAQVHSPPPSGEPGPRPQHTVPASATATGPLPQGPRRGFLGPWPAAAPPRALRAPLRPPRRARTRASTPPGRAVGVVPSAPGRSAAARAGLLWAGRAAAAAAAGPGASEGASERRGGARRRQAPGGGRPGRQAPERPVGLDFGAEGAPDHRPRSSDAPQPRPLTGG